MRLFQLMRTWADQKMSSMQRRQLHSKVGFDQPNGVDDHVKDDRSSEISKKPSPLASTGVAKMRRNSGQEVYDDGTKTFFWYVNTRYRLQARCTENIYHLIQ